MAKKKEEIPPYVLRTLTGEYLIEGMVAGDTGLNFATDDQMHTPIHFSSVRISFIRSAVRNERAYQEMVVKKNQTLIYIPDTDYTRLPQISVWNQFKTPINGDFYVGPYHVTGRMMTINRFMFNDELPVLDARINSPLSGSGWHDIFAPFIIVNGHQLHGWSEH